MEEFLNSLAGENQVRFRLIREFDLVLDHGEPATVRGHHGELASPETQQHTVEHVPRFVGRRGVGRLPQHLPEHTLVHGVAMLLFRAGHGWKFVPAHPVDPEMRGSAVQCGHVAVADRQTDRRIGQFAHDDAEPFNRKRADTLVLNLRFNTAPHRDFQVGRGEPQLVVLGRQQHVVQNGKRRARPDDILHHVQSVQQSRFCQLQLHGSSLPFS